MQLDETPRERVFWRGVVRLHQAGRMPMNDMSRSHVTPPSPIAEAYVRDGFFCPYDVTSEAAAAEILADLEAGEAELADPQRRAELSMLRSYPARLLPTFDRLIRHPRLIDAVS